MFWSIIFTRELGKPNLDFFFSFIGPGIISYIFAGSNPAGFDGFFQSLKILSVTSFGREVKPWVTRAAREVTLSEDNF